MVWIALLALGVLGLVVWNMLAWPGLRPIGGDPGVRVSVLIPARDEAANIAECLETVSAQGDVVAEVLVYDDHSTDDTARLVERAADFDARVRLLKGDTLPEGWKGKPFACYRLAHAAAQEWLLFLDADARLSDGAANAMAQAALRTRATMLSFWPGLTLESFVEKALMPMLNMVVFTLYPAPMAFRRNWASLGLAHGACILVHAETYRRLGGHELVAKELFEDTALAREWRKRGERSLCFDGQRLVRVRMYRSFGELWAGFRKNFYPAFRTKAGFVLFLAFHAAVFLAPFVVLAADFARGRASVEAAVAAGAVIGMRVAQAWRFGYPIWSALLHPLAEAVLLALGVASWFAMASGRGVEWKGRRYGLR